MAKLTKAAERRIYLQFLASKASLPLACDPENEYRDNVIVAQQGEVRLLYSAQGERYEVDNWKGDFREALVVLRDNNVILEIGPNKYAIELKAVCKTRDEAMQEQYWEAHSIYRMILTRDGLTNNSAFEGYE